MTDDEFDALRAVEDEIHNEVVAAFKRAYPDCDSWPVEAKLDRLSLWIRANHSPDPEQKRVAQRRLALTAIDGGAPSPAEWVRPKRHPADPPPGPPVVPLKPEGT